MKKLFTILALTILVGGQSFGQQDPMFTKYMFNSLVFNPAYAGSWDHMTIGLIHRSQWVEIEGSPTTQSLTLHTPLRNERIGVGVSLVNDKIGPTNSTGLNLAYAYKIPLGKMKLSIGLQAGMENYNADVVTSLIKTINSFRAKCSVTCSGCLAPGCLAPICLSLFPSLLMQCPIFTFLPLSPFSLLPNIHSKRSNRFI